MTKEEFEIRVKQKIAAAYGNDLDVIIDARIDAIITQVMDEIINDKLKTMIRKAINRSAIIRERINGALEFYDINR